MPDLSMARQRSNVQHNINFHCGNVSIAELELSYIRKHKSSEAYNTWEPLEHPEKSSPGQVDGQREERNQGGRPTHVTYPQNTLQSIHGK